MTVTPFRDVLGEKAKLTLWLLMGAAAFVLIIACANVANLTLMRGVRREHELVVRAALGAGVARLRKLLLVENLLLALTGERARTRDRVRRRADADGARGAVQPARRRDPHRRRRARIHAAARHRRRHHSVVRAESGAAKASLNGVAVGGCAASDGDVRRQRLQQTLVVAQVAVSVMLLTGAGLLMRTMQQLSEVSTGLTSDNAHDGSPEDFNGVKKDEMIADYRADAAAAPVAPRREAGRPRIDDAAARGRHPARRQGGDASARSR